MNLISFFRSLDTSTDTGGTLYKIEVITNPQDTGFTEISTASDSPFVVEYEESGIFEPLRKSTATINFVIGSIPEVFSHLAQATQVKLSKQNNSRVFETEWIGYLKPNIYNQQEKDCYDTIEFEASDCIASLQYFNYEPFSGTSKQIVTVKQLLNHICNRCGLLSGYFIPDTKQINGTSISNSLENLKISEKNFFSSDVDKPWTYYEVLQELSQYLGFTALQWKDRLYFVDNAFAGSNANVTGKFFEKANNYATSVLTFNQQPKITEDKLRGASTELSYENIYNKVTVNDSLYKVEYFIPDLFEDDYLTNRYGNFNEYVEIPAKLSVCEGFAEYEPVFISEKGKQSKDADDSKKQFYRRLYDNKYYSSVYYTSGGTQVTLTDAQKQTTACTRDYIGGTIVDFACVEKQDSNVRQQEANGSVTFQRYLMVSQMDTPSGNTYIAPRTGSTYLNDFKKVLELKSGYTFPVLLDGNNSFLSLNCTSLFEKYKAHDYINTDWTDENVGIGFLTGRDPLKNYTSTNGSPKLYFLLKIGNKYWNGKQWTTTETGFLPETEYSKDGDGNPDFRNWNKELKILNTIDWKEGAGETGYKIPLDTSLDLNAEIKFEVHCPSRLSTFYSTNGGRIYDNDGLNNYCWLKDFSLKLTNSKSDYELESDYIYENVIESGSTNELDEIQFRITTWSGQGALSFSHMGLDSGFLLAIKELGLSGSAQKPEENTIEKYVNYYSTKTIKLGYVVDCSYHPLARLSEDLHDENFVVVGQLIDYAANTNEIHLAQAKDLTEGDLSEELTFTRNGRDIIAATGGSAYFTVLSNYPWSATTSVAGIGTLSQTGGTGNGVEQNFNYTFNTNTEDSRRKQTVTVTNGFNTKSIEIYQISNYTGITLYSYYNGVIGDKIKEINVGHNSGSTLVYANYSGEILAYTNDDWNDVEEIGNGVFQITFDENSDGYERFGFIYFLNDFTLQSIDLIQQPDTSIRAILLEPQNNISYDGGNVSYRVYSETPWTATTSFSDGSWVKNTGSNGETLSYLVNENSGSTQRGISFTITNSFGTSITTPTKVQTGKNLKYSYFSMSQTDYSQAQVNIFVPQTGGTYTVYVHSNQPWQMNQTSIQGVSISPTMGNSGVTPLTLTIGSQDTFDYYIWYLYAQSDLSKPANNSNVLFIMR